MNRAVEASRPDLVFHLAGISFPPDADRTPDVTFDVNTLGAVRLAKFTFVRIHAFAGEGQQPDKLSAEEIQQLLGGIR